MTVSALSARFAAVGFPTWVLVNALWTELAVFADRLPEGYDIGAYLMLALTLSNAAPAAMHVLIRTQDISAQKRNLWAVHALGGVTTVLLGACWSVTTRVGGGSYSVPLLLLTVAAGATCNSTTVTHFSFVGHYDRRYTSMLSFGAGLGSFFVGILAIFQYTVAPAHQFSVSAFFYICLAPWIVACVALPQISTADAASSSSSNEPTPLLEDMESSSAILTESEELNNGDMGGDKTGALTERRFLDRFRGFLLVHFLVCSLGYGMIPAVISVVCGKYESGSASLLMWSTVLVCFFDPIARGLTYYYASHRFGVLAILWGVSAFLVLLPLALPSSSSFFSDSAIGAVPATAYVVFMSVFSYTVTCHFLYIHAEMQKMHASPEFNSRAYSWVGFITQCGSVAGTLVAFLVVIFAP